MRRMTTIERNTTRKFFLFLALCMGLAILAPVAVLAA